MKAPTNALQFAKSAPAPKSKELQENVEAYAQVKFHCPFFILSEWAENTNSFPHFKIYIYIF